MNKNIIIAFLIGVIITLVAVNYLPKFDIKIEMAKKTEPVKIDETQKDDSFLNETTEIVNNTITKNKKIEEKPSKPANELSVKEEKTNPLDKYLPNKDKYKDLENSQYSYSEPVELEERTDPFDIPDRPEQIKEPDIPLIDIPKAKKPEMTSESIKTPDFGGPKFGSFSASADGDVRPIVKVPPQYPRSAIQRCLEGWVMLELTITETGAVINPVVLDAEPPGIFNRSAQRAMAKWKYKPKIVNGKTVPKKGVQHVIQYELGPEGCQKRTKLSDLRQPKYIEPNLNSINKTKLPESIPEDITGRSKGTSERCLQKVGGVCRKKEANYEERLRVYNYSCNVDPLLEVSVPPEYPARAKQRGIEGWALVEYTVTKTGNVINPVVIAADPPGIFNRAALRSFVKFKYLPAKKNCQKIETKKVQRLATWELEDKR